MEPSSQRASSSLRRKLAALLSVTALLGSLLTCASFASLDPDALDTRGFWIVAVVTTICAQVLAVLIAALAHATLSMQLTGLAARVRKLRERQDFSRRVGPTRHRLLHELTSALDELLWTVEVREKELLRQRTELEDVLAARSRELEKKTREQKLLLENVDQGVLLLDSESLPGGTRSVAFDRWFGAPEPGQTFGKVIARAASDFDQRFADPWKRMSEGYLPVELEVLSLPAQFSTENGRHYHLAYRLDGSSTGRFEQLLVLVSDITAQVGRDQAEAERAQLATLIEQISRDRVSFATRFHEIDVAMHRLPIPGDPDATQLPAALGQLRAQLGGLRLRALAALVKSLEEAASGVEGMTLVPDDLLELTDAWERFAAHARLLTGEASPLSGESLNARRAGTRY
ncbi:MAG: hypothetical protein ABW252_02955 [Polyangiales bacterium]